MRQRSWTARDAHRAVGSFAFGCERSFAVEEVDSLTLSMADLRYHLNGAPTLLDRFRGIQRERHD